MQRSEQNEDDMNWTRKNKGIATTAQKNVGSTNRNP